jgi:hypothetical protein
MAFSARLLSIWVLPDIYVEKTIKGIREGRDEFLEKALEIAEKIDIAVTKN